MHQGEETKMSNDFLRGMSEAFNLFPQEREATVLLPYCSDEEAFRNDLEQVGYDMRAAIQSHDR